MTEGSRTDGSIKRIYGLDVWRGLLLLVTPLVHCAVVAGDVSGYKGLLPNDIAVASHDFRMPMFFFISGFLSAHSQRKGAHWLNLRVLQLGVPLAFVWIFVLTPMTLSFAIPSPARGNPFNPMHLWFLVSLIVVTIPVYYADRATGFRLLVLSRPDLRFWFPICLALGAVVGAVNYSRSRWGIPEPLPSVVGSPIEGYYYLVGFAVQRNPSFVDAIKRSKMLAVGPIAWIAWVLAHHVYHTQLSLPHQHQVVRLVFFSSSAIISVFLSITMMASAYRITHRPALVARISAASYTIYLLHVPFLFLFAMALGRELTNFFVLFAALLPLTIAVSFYLHEHFVERYDFAMLLINGRRRGRLGGIAPFRSGPVKNAPVAGTPSSS